MALHAPAPRALLRSAGPSPIIEAFYFLLTLVAVLAGKMPLTLLFGNGAEAGLYLIVIYVWAQREVSALAPLLIFVAGLVQDILSGAPFGLMAGLFCGHFIVTRWQVQFIGLHTMPIIFLGFVGGALVFYLMLYIMGSLSSVAAIDWGVLANSFTLTLIFYLPIILSLALFNFLIGHYVER